MIKFYQNRELSAKLDIKLAKWKRWSREFLPPDPLGGLQSGYARQYSIDDAFTVYLGGYLVAGLKFSIPAAKQVLKDLREWMQSRHFFYFFDHVNGKKTLHHVPSRAYCIYISAGEGGPQSDLRFSYVIKRVLGNEPEGKAGSGAEEERYRVEPLAETGACSGMTGREFRHRLLGARVLYISNLHQTFMDALGVG